MIVKIDMTKSLTDKWKHEYSRPRELAHKMLLLNSIKVNQSNTFILWIFMANEMKSINQTNKTMDIHDH